jgi:hypothetical protein
MELAYSEWQDNSESDEKKELYFWEKRISTAPCFFEYFAFFSMRKEVKIMGLAYSESSEKCAPNHI